MEDHSSQQDEIRTETAPQDENEVRVRHESNRAGWNKGAERYSAELEAAIARLKSKKSSLHPIEKEHLGDLSPWCDTAIHLQCASGEDTLSLWLEGARRVIGVDISDVHIENARRTSAELNAPAQWYRCDILDTPHELDGTADLVYTGQGALCWIQDIQAWAQVVARLLKPGGLFHVLDDHPANWMFDNGDAVDLQPTYVSYFDHCESSQGWPSSYIGDLGVPVTSLPRKYERLWNLSSIFRALHRAGLQIEDLGEYPQEYWNAFPNLKPEYKRLIPMTFSITARKL